MIHYTCVSCLNQTQQQIKACHNHTLHQTNDHNHTLAQPYIIQRIIIVAYLHSISMYTIRVPGGEGSVHLRAVILYVYKLLYYHVYDMQHITHYTYNIVLRATTSGLPCRLAAQGGTRCNAACNFRVYVRTHTITSIMISSIVAHKSTCSGT